MCKVNNLFIYFFVKKIRTKKENDYVANDMVDEVVQQEYSDNKCYASVFRYTSIMRM